MQGGGVLSMEARAASGPHDFESLFSSERTRIVRHLRYLTGDLQVSEDLAQEAFVRLWERAAADGSGAVRDPGPWLLRVASNLAYNHFRAEERRRAREDRAGVQDALCQHTGECGSSSLEEAIDVRDALTRMGARDRTVLLLRHSGSTYAEIAEVIGIAPGSVGTTLARAQSRFREAYEGYSAESSREKRK